MKRISIVVPMYNEEEMIPVFFQTIDPIISSLPNYAFEIVAVNDGSRDKTLSLLLEAQKTHPHLVVVSLSRNFGHEPAVCAGLKTATGDAVIPMDADLQDPPEIIGKLIEKFEEGYEVVNARRASRKEDSFMKRFTAAKFYELCGKLSGKIKVPANVGHFRLISRRVCDEVNALTEKNRVFRVQVPYVGHKTTEVLFNRAARAKGKTHYNYKSMFKLAFDAIVASTVEPLNWPLKWTIASAVKTGISVVAELVFFILYLTNVFTLIPLLGFGIWLIINVIFAFGTFILAALAIYGIYLSRITLETQNRPFVIIDRVYTNGGK